jgi:hypothetical protein
MSESTGITAVDVLSAFPGARVVAEDKPTRCEHCAKLKRLPEWRRDGNIVERTWPNGRREWACSHCGHVAKIIAESSSPSPDLEAVYREFLKPIFRGPSGNVELRAFPSCSRIFCRIERRDKILEFVAEHLHEEVFFGVATRAGTDGSKEGALETRALWADLDLKNFQGGEAEALEVVKAFPPKPSFVVKSGHGWHLYWLLRKPVAASPELEAYLKGIAKALRADPACAEISRVMRLPHSFNRKGGKEILVTFQEGAR